MQFQSTVDFTLKSVNIYPVGSDKKISITNLVNTFNYVESILAPCVVGNLQVVDSAGFLQQLPIQGTEIVEISVVTSASQEPVDYRFRVWKVANRYVQNQQQAYTLGLISEEALNNEAIKITKSVAGKPDEISKNLISTTLQSSKTLFTEPALREVKMMAVRRRPFDIITYVARKAISSKAGGASTNKTKNNKPSAEGNEENAKKSTGSAGFLFWENRRGFNFFSVDSMCADEKSSLRSENYTVGTWGPYVEKLVNQEDGADNRFTIASARFTTELDLMQSLRLGKFSSRIIFFNYSTGEYSEYIYKIGDSYDKMSHLGAQDGLKEVSASNINLSTNPTRVISTLIDHETWHNEPGPASHEEQDQNNAGESTASSYADFDKDFLVQAFARYQTLRNQSCSIIIPGNPDICAGDKIDIRLKNKVPNEQTKTEPWDTESSGVYLIEEVTHSYDRTAGKNGEFFTTLRLMRDSYGMKDQPSNHGNK